jgi:predicted phosphodiesterase
VLVFGGPYSNLQATQALFAAAERRGIPAHRIICTGDVVAYCADPQPAVDLLRAAGVHVVMGNCEESLGADAEDCGCGFEQGTTCDRLSAAWYDYSRRRLDIEAKRWMAGLPHWIRLELGGRRLTVVHGAPSAINRFVFASAPQDEKAREIQLTAGDGVICGHSGLPFTQIIGDRLWHNAGVVGLPANDGTPRVWYSLLSPSPEGIVIRHIPLDYDHEVASRRIRAEGLPDEYATALMTGYWDNCDILPPPETAAQGNRLSPETILWPAETQSAADPAPAFAGLIEA